VAAVSVTADLFHPFFIFIFKKKPLSLVSGLTARMHISGGGLLDGWTISPLVFSQDYLYACVEVVAASLTGYLIYLMRVQYKSTYQVPKP